MVPLLRGTGSPCDFGTPFVVCFFVYFSVDGVSQRTMLETMFSFLQLLRSNKSIDIMH